jgi:RRXRR protein
MSAHSVFVLDVDGKPLAPTTPARARKLLEAGVARKRWSKFGTFGIQLLAPSRSETPLTALGVDHGTKFEGYAVVCGDENALAIKLDLPDKKKIVRKITERRVLRRARRYRKCRRRPMRFQNRSRKGFLAPSQSVIVGSRLKVLRELFRIYPITAVGFEDVCFNHAAKRSGANFSTVEIGKAQIKEFFKEQGADLFCFKGFQTRELREKYGCPKTSDKAADRFEAHCSDALALAVEVGPGSRVEPGHFRVVDDTYRSVRRRLHDTQPGRGGVRAPYSRGTVFGLRKGLKLGTPRQGRLCGEYKSSYRYYDEAGKRQSAKRLSWVSAQFITRRGDVASPVS